MSLMIKKKTIKCVVTYLKNELKNNGFATSFDIARKIQVGGSRKIPITLTEVSLVLKALEKNGLLTRRGQRYYYGTEKEDSEHSGSENQNSF